MYTLRTMFQQCRIFPQKFWSKYVAQWTCSYHVCLKDQKLGVESQLRPFLFVVSVLPCGYVGFAWMGGYWSPSKLYNFPDIRSSTSQPPSIDGPHFLCKHPQVETIKGEIENKSLFPYVCDLFDITECALNSIW